MFLMNTLGINFLKSFQGSDLSRGGLHCENVRWSSFDNCYMGKILSDGKWETMAWDRAGKAMPARASVDFDLLASI